MSERWASNAEDWLFKLSLNIYKDSAIYVKFFKLLYLTQGLKSFANVEEALDMLEVAAMLLCTDIMEVCMRYLEVVPWSHGNEEAISSCISSLRLIPSPDMAARLSTDDVNPKDVIKHVLGKLLPYVASNARARVIVERLLLSSVESSISDTVNGPALYEELLHSVDSLKFMLQGHYMEDDVVDFPNAFFKVEWLLEHVCKHEAGVSAITIFANDAELAALVVQHFEPTRTFYYDETIGGQVEHVDHHCDPDRTKQFVSTIFNHMLRALQNMKLMVPKAVKVALIINWLPALFKLDSNMVDVETLDNVIAALPVKDQCPIFYEWLGTSLRAPNSNFLTKSFDKWCLKLNFVQRQKDHI